MSYEDASEMYTQKVSLVITFLVVMTSFHLVVTVLPSSVSAATHYVGGLGPGNSTKIGNALSIADPGDTVFVYNGTYKESFTLNKVVSLIGEDRDTTIIDGDGQGDVIRITADGVTFKGFTVVKSRTYDYDAGIKLDHVGNCHIADNNASSNLNGILLAESHHNVIANNTAWSNRVGMRLSDSDGNLISENTFLDSRTAIEIHFSNENEITGNVGTENGGTVWLLNSSHNIIENNYFSRNLVHIDNSPGNIVVNNTILNNSLLVHRSSDTTISHNSVAGIYLSYSQSANLFENTILETGIEMKGDLRQHWNTHAIDVSNMVNSGPVYYWKNTSEVWVPPGAGQIILGNCSGVRIENINISGGPRGIQIGFSSNVYVLNNTISSNEVDGIFLMYTSQSHINDNVVSSNNGEGVSLWHSEENHVARNIVSHNLGYGIQMFYSNSNKIFHNSLVDNRVQAYDVPASNQWDFGYPAGGNYWADYTGSDRFSGSNQGHPGSDGMGDTPHDIYSHSGPRSIDRYPLMRPFVTPTPIPECQPPTLTIASPISSMSVSGVCPINGTSLDPDGTVKRIEVRVGLSPWIEAEGEELWTYEWNTAKVPNGEYTIYVRAFDGESYSTEMNVTVTVNNESPGGLNEGGLWMAIGAIVVIFIVILLIVLWVVGRRKRRDEEPVDESYEEEFEN